MFNMKEGNVLTTLNTFYLVIWRAIYGKGPHRERKPAAATWATLSNWHQGFFYMHPRHDNTYHSLCYTSCGASVGRRNSQWVHHEGSIQLSNDKARKYFLNGIAIEKNNTCTN